MKTTLLFVLAIFLGVTLSAQSSHKPVSVNPKAKVFLNQNNRIETESTSTTPIPAYVPKKVKGVNADVAKVFMGTSRNAFTLLVNEQTGIWFNKEVGAVMSNFRGNDKPVAGLPAPVGTGNDVITSWTTDNGTTQNVKIALTGTSVYRSRYPSGVIYNPAGNTDLNLAYSLVAGPVTNGAGWTNTYLSSVQYNGNNLDIDYLPVSTYGELVRQGLSVCDDGVAHICTVKSADDGTNYTELIGHVKKGVFNTNTLGFDWTEQDIPVNYWNNGGLPEGNTYANMAWNKSGSVGYVMFLGVDARSTDHKGYYPIIYKSVDQGDTWQLQDYFDFSTMPQIFEYVGSLNADPETVVPWFWESDMVVDANNDLHIMALLKGHISQDPDSLNWYNQNEFGGIFEFTNTSGSWMCQYITTPLTREVSGDDSPYQTSPPPNVGWDMRLNASRTDDGTKVFAVWTDTDPANWPLTDPINLYPDLWVWGRDILTNKYSDVKNITTMNEGMGECHFMFASPITIDNSDEFDIPVRISDINTSNLNADEPVAHYYLQGTTIMAAEFVHQGITPRQEANKVVAVNYPNPFNGTTSIDVNLPKAANVTLTVNNITAQQVAKVDFGKMAAGTQKLTFDGSQLSSGVYFFTVTMGDVTATGKMVVK